MLSKYFVRTAARAQPSVPPCRLFSQASYLGSGHSRWSKIKHDKGKADAVKSKERTVFIDHIIRASKDGGPDPNLNTALAFAISSAKKGQVPKESIAVAIAKGQGKSVSGVALDYVFIEAMLPANVAAIIECQTDNKTRILANVKAIVQRAGGSLTPTTFCFDKKGKIWFRPHKSVGVDEAMDEAIEAGAEEISLEDGAIVVETAPEFLIAVGQKLKSSLGLEIERSQTLYDPKEDTLVKLDEEQALKLQETLNRLEELEDIQDMYINAET